MARTLIGNGSFTSSERLSWAALVLLLGLCLLQGLSWTAGLTQPPDADQLRDIGFAQAILDGKWFGDPLYRGEWRWYPPLAHAIDAAAMGLSGAFPPTLWIRLGPWLNLLAPFTFFLMNRRLLGAPAAACASLAFVLVDGAVARPWVTGGYTPWLLAPYVALPFFFGAVCLIHARAGSARLRDAALIGLLLGVVFLVHTVPALLLSAIAAAVAFVENGVKVRTILWLAIVAAFELALGMIFLAPLLLHYRLHIINHAPGAYIDGLLLPSRLFTAAAVANAPGLVATAVAWRLRRFAPLDRRSATILVTWIGVCVLFLARHYVCALSGVDNPVCRAFVVPINHFHLYLNIAWACLIGHVGWHLGRLWLPAVRASKTLRISATLAAVAILAAGIAWFFDRPYDRYARKQAQSEGVVFDRAAYQWILANTAPTDIFVTDLAALNNDDPAAFSVIAAGRHLVAAPELHSNPYVDWHERDARRRRYLSAALHAKSMPDPDLCAFAAEAGRDGAAWMLLPNAMVIAEPAAERRFRDKYFSIYRVRDARCRH